MKPSGEDKYAPLCKQRGLTTSQLPSGLAAAPFTWEYLGVPFAMELVGSFVGVAQDKRTLALRPEIGWAVRVRPTA